jgi:hypothetical protein
MRCDILDCIDKFTKQRKTQRTFWWSTNGTHRRLEAVTSYSEKFELNVARDKRFNSFSYYRFTICYIIFIV